ncbi:MAG: hypothetical protein A2667_01440 [Candidatus Wildermuthbacteria bacterium RIFCSPHIGHO2_01_FULL_47_27]|uniref:Type II secretion system protein GspI C-terminal domain-containing protein n=2 Tax=Candidatus Wildermuthiibacteriota TaxID=1817923 RepID=A0A1G2RRG4_9BACT|nr:MAG: hypothetical protein UY15_C0012G0005 [Parcubacteria group bacterium GW2011_GWA2_47_9]OHA64254.1 MAG: hypothetical protein A2667_01440 [Candidatus Wildermuthbacteria bacterium RIFCSPHIGHO2_01_FULL_47_27]OHA67608.1 MAG: hypothetical protein A3D59_03510 [Candidatus Wildermuthbacteria bacterium RIFCSPHIGHO2_02_FULL_47_17]OHA75214.1 MAG: hypothetical protein A3I38_01545 [Candidatus Wildermuthbacteria bacterium RIFCSPLOWO2_02_FULL_47_10]OHA75454.1 MAG: hypothetical protein A3A32_02440 [Candid
MPIKTSKGFSIIEVLISTAILAALVVSFTILVTEAAVINRDNLFSLRAEMYAREPIEAVKDLEQSNWAAIVDAICASPNICHPEISGGAWTLDAGTINDGVFTRWITIEDVWRSPPPPVFPNTVVKTGGAVGANDPDTKKVTAYVSWAMKDRTKTISLETYVYNTD